MRRALTWLAGLAGIAALLRRRSRQQAPAPQTAPSAPPPDPVLELRQKLEETRASDPAPAEATGSPLSLDERRTRVHERAQDAIDLMRSSDDEPATD
jgi:hypothetical protein